MDMSRLTRDGTAEPVSRDQILRHARVQGKIIFPVQLTTSRIGNLTRLIHTLLYVMTIHTYIHIHTCTAVERMCGLSTVVTPAGASLTMYREIRPHANSIWDDNNNNNIRVKKFSTSIHEMLKYFTCRTNDDLPRS